MMRWWVFGEDQLISALNDWHSRLAQENGAAASLSTDLVKQFLSSPEAAEQGLIGGMKCSNNHQPKEIKHDQARTD